MFRGNAPARIDDKGRLKVPNAFRSLLESPDLTFLMEAHDGLSAKIVEEAGFPAIWASGLTVSAALGVRDSAMNERLSQALRGNPLPAVRRVRRDRHAPEASCWLHGPTCCISLT